MDRRAEAIEALQGRLGYRFADRELLDRALTHASAADGSGKAADNERLEFLGDRVLGLIIAEALAAREATATVGALSKRLHVLVSGAACARVARSIGLSEAMRFQGSGRAGKSRDNSTILADGCEALIAAHYLEAGLDQTTAMVLELWRPLMDEPFDLERVDPKSRLQEWAAAGGRPAPVYRMATRSGPDHRPLFTVEVTLAGAEPMQAQGPSLREAEKAAALAMLRRERAQ